MIVAEVNTDKGNFHVIAEDESDARDKINEYLRKRYFTESVAINSIDILACSKKFYSNNTLVV